MSINIVSCMFILDSEQNNNIRKNDIKRIKVLTDKHENLPLVNYTGNEIKKETRKYIESILGTNIFHLEQVYTIEEDNGVSIIYLGITNRDHVNLNDNYQLVDFKISDNVVTFSRNTVGYKTIPIEINNNIEYSREYETNDLNLIKTLTKLLIACKRIRGNIDHTDIIFKFMSDSFTLEDVRLVYELITEKKVDKSNFRKKIVKYCEKTDNITSKKGYRPSQSYKFKPLKEDIWL